MGNCWKAPSKRDNSLSLQANSEVTKVPNRSGQSIVASGQSVRAQSEKKESGTLPSPRSEENILSSPNLKPFTFNELKNATRNFCPDGLLGEGGFGYVYKGWIDEQTLGAVRPGSGMVVAVKMLKPGRLQGHQEWLSEVNHLGQLLHPNLVRLIGYCMEGENRLLVYEYMPEGSLENHLFERDAQPLCWAIRIKVAVDAARGLSFLHDSKPQVIFRDFKSANILLDSEFNAKLSDFGLAREGPTGDHTHVSTRIMGTLGYAAPEYYTTGKLTARCDVYSYGIVLLELLSGRPAIDKTKVGKEQNIVHWVKPYFSDQNKLLGLMDTKLEPKYPRRSAFVAAALAGQCISEAKNRPQMSEVLAKLEWLLPAAKYANSPGASSSHHSI